APETTRQPSSSPAQRSPTPPLPRIIITGDERIAETKVIARIYHTYPRDAAWATPEQVWSALLRTNHELTPARVNALSPEILCYWTTELLRQQTEQAVEGMLAFMDTKVRSDITRFIHTWMDHIRHIVRRDRGDEEASPSSSEYEEESSTRAPPPPPTSDQ